MDFYSVMLKHAADYPDMKPQDWLKLAYQSEFGCFHIMEDQDGAYKALCDELEKTQHNGLMPIYEEIGGGYSRLNLAAVKGVIPPEIIFKMMQKSCIEKGEEDRFPRRLTLIAKSAKMGIIKFDYKALEECFSAYDMSDGAPSHSVFFRAKYKPSYRVVKTEFAETVPVLELIYEALNQSGYADVAIDGRCGSGKTTYAYYIAQITGADIIHADDYFLPAERKTAERLAEAGGNLDRERLISEVLSHLHDETITHSKFDCHTGKLLPPKELKRGDILIVEGTYVLHPEMKDYFNVRIMTDTDVISQRERLTERDGQDKFDRYLKEWIPLEEAYFRTMPPDTADLIVKN